MNKIVDDDFYGDDTSPDHRGLLLSGAGGAEEASFHDFDDVDDFAGSGFAGDTATWNKVSKKLMNDGYRIGKEEEEGRQMQHGFNRGFSDGGELGMLCGKLYAALIFESSLQLHQQQHRIGDQFTEIERLVFEEIPRKCSNVPAAPKGDTANTNRIIKNCENSSSCCGGVCNNMPSVKSPSKYDVEAAERLVQLAMAAFDTATPVITQLCEELRTVIKHCA
jgi:hypothetical protein